MQTKWFQPASWRTQDARNGRTNSAPKQTAAAPAESSPASRLSSANATNFVASEGELLPFEEIYRVAGIKGPRLGYSISKVIEMLHSEHIRNLQTETKRASLLMALEAAGVQVDEVLQDATMRQRAINSYEAIQRKHVEEYEARKAQDNCAIQAEMERVTAQYLARINGNLDEVARAKDNFRKWQARKQNEAQRIAEAVALCVTHGGGQQTDSISSFRELANGEPSFVNQ
jgi:hypothetical protein